MLILEPRSSSRARLLVVVTYLLACAGLVAYAPGPLAVALGLAGAAAALLEWRASCPPARLEYRADGEWWVEDEGPWYLQSASVLTSWLVVLVLDNGSRRKRLPLLPDSLPAMQWRRLRAALRQSRGDVSGP